MGILNQLDSVEDEERLAEFLEVNDKLSDKLQQYELAMSGQIPAQTGRTAIMETDTTLSDGQAFRNEVSSPQQVLWCLAGRGCARVYAINGEKRAVLQILICPVVPCSWASTCNQGNGACL